jgi:hypothetical protein
VDQIAIEMHKISSIKEESTSPMTDYEAQEDPNVREIPLFTVEEESFDGLKTTELLSDLQMAKNMLQVFSKNIGDRDLADLISADNKSLSERLKPLLTYVLNKC